jgi:hypothetical protein
MTSARRIPLVSTESAWTPVTAARVQTASSPTTGPSVSAPRALWATRKSNANPWVVSPTPSVKIEKPAAMANVLTLVCWTIPAASMQSATLSVTLPTVDASADMREIRSQDASPSDASRTPNAHWTAPVRTGTVSTPARLTTRVPRTPTASSTSIWLSVAVISDSPAIRTDPVYPSPHRNVWKTRIVRPLKFVTKKNVKILARNFLPALHRQHVGSSILYPSGQSLKHERWGSINDVTFFQHLAYHLLTKSVMLFMDFPFN